jgi:hypothetical protein
MTTEQVQQWVISALIGAVATFPVGALIATSVVKDRAGVTGDAIALGVMASLIGVVAVGAARLVHRRQPLSPYLLLGAVPGFTTVAWLLI